MFRNRNVWNGYYGSYSPSIGRNLNPRFLGRSRSAGYGEVGVSSLLLLGLVI